MKQDLLWVIDGHNLIFQTPSLEELQVSGRRAEARRELEELLRDFAGRRREKVIIVYDGNDQAQNPDVVREPFLETTYSQPPEEADDRILYLARNYGEREKRVRVVTSDIRTLAQHLPESASHLTAQQFRRRHLTRRRQGKRVEGDFSDVEAEFLRADAAQANAPRPAAPSSVAPTPPPPSPVSPARKAPSGAAAAERRADPAAAERLRLKKEKGRRRQERRLADRRRKR